MKMVRAILGLFIGIIIGTIADSAGTAFVLGMVGTYIGYKYDIRNKNAGSPNIDITGQHGLYTHDQIGKKRKYRTKSQNTEHKIYSVAPLPYNLYDIAIINAIKKHFVKKDIYVEASTSNVKSGLLAIKLYNILSPVDEPDCNLVLLIWKLKLCDKPSLDCMRWFVQIGTEIRNGQNNEYVSEGCLWGRVQHHTVAKTITTRLEAPDELKSREQCMDEIMIS